MTKAAAPARGTSGGRLRRAKLAATATITAARVVGFSGQPKLRVPTKARVMPNAAGACAQIDWLATPSIGVPNARTSAAGRAPRGATRLAVDQTSATEPAA